MFFRERQQIRTCTCKKRNARFQQISFLDRHRAHQRCSLFFQSFRKSDHHLRSREGCRCGLLGERQKARLESLQIHGDSVVASAFGAQMFMRHHSSPGKTSNASPLQLEPIRTRPLQI